MPAGYSIRNKSDGDRRWSAPPLFLSLCLVALCLACGDAGCPDLSKKKRGVPIISSRREIVPFQPASPCTSASCAYPPVAQPRPEAPPSRSVPPAHMAQSRFTHFRATRNTHSFSFLFECMCSQPRVAFRGYLARVQRSVCGALFAPDAGKKDLPRTAAP